VLLRINKDTIVGAKIQKKFRILALILLMILVSGVFVIIKNYSEVRALITDGGDAVNLFGQYEINGDLDYTKDTDPDEWINNFGLDGAMDVTVDEIHHQLFISEYTNNRVVVYDLNESNEPEDYIQDYVLGQNSFETNAPWNADYTHPGGLEVSSDGNLLFVSLVGASANVAAYSLPISSNNPDPVGYIDPSGIPLCDADHMSNPVDMEYVETAGTKYLIVADSSFNRVVFYNITHPPLITKDYVLGQANLVSCMEGPISASTLSTPRGVAYDTGADSEVTTDDRIFVADAGRNRVLVYDLSLGALASGRAADYVLGQTDFVSSAGGGTRNSDFDKLYTSGVFGSASVGLVFDSGNNRLIVPDLGNARLINFDTEIIASGEAGTDLLVEAPVFGTFPYGFYYNATRDFAYSAEGWRVIGMHVPTFEFGVDELFGQVDGNGNFVQSSGGGGNSSPNDRSVSGANFVTVDSASHRMFVGDPSGLWGYRILMLYLDENNELTDYVADSVLGAGNPNAANFAGVSDTTFTELSSAVFDSINNRLYVTDKYRVLVFDTETVMMGEPAVNVLGQVDFTHNASPVGISASVFESDGLALDTENGLLYVSDELYNRVLVFDVNEIENGEDAIKVLGAPDLTSYYHEAGDFCKANSMENPSGLAYDSTRHYLYVGDTSGTCSRLMIFDTSTIINNEDATNVLGQATLTSTAPVTLDASHFTAVGLSYDDVNQRLFVTDSRSTEHNRILVFDLGAITDGEDAVNVLGQDDFFSQVAETTQDGLNAPQDVEYVASARQLVVADDGNNRIMFFDADTGAPIAPSDFTITDAGIQSISLSWTDNSSDETGFELYKKAAGEEDWTEVDLGVAPDEESYVVNDLEPHTHYYFRLRAYNESGCTDYVTTDGTTSAIYPEVPSLTSPEDEASDVSTAPTFTFSADNVEGYENALISYRIEFASDENFLTTDKYYDQRTNPVGWSLPNGSNPGEAVSFVIPTSDYFSPGQTYYWRVRAFTNDIPSDTYSEVRSFTVVASAPSNDDGIPAMDSLTYRNLIDSENTNARISSGSVKLEPEISLTEEAAGFSASMAKAFDADSDGDLDLVTCYMMDDPNTLKIRFNDGAGNFETVFEGGASCDDLAIADIDLDGDLDVLVVMEPGWNVIRNDGGGDFSVIVHGSDDFGRSIATGDFNHDGYPDFLVGNNWGAGNEAKIMLNNGAGSFSLWEDSPLAGVNNPAEDVFAGDLNGDNYDDFVIYAPNGESYIYLNDRLGGFDEHVWTLEEGIAENQMAVFDYDGDGDLDLYEYTHFYKNDGLGNFTYSNQSVPWLAGMNLVGTADFDGDGDQDVIVSNIMDSEVEVFQNLGRGIFSEESLVVYGGGAGYSVAVGSFNGDGAVDFLEVAGPASAMITNSGGSLFEETPVDGLGSYVEAVFDADNDGDMDLWTGTFGQRTIKLNQGDGHYNDVVVEDSVGLEGMVYKAEAIDVDNDGDFDIVEAVRDGVNALYFNDGNGGFTLQEGAFGDEAYHSVYMRSGDINNDGRIDFIFLNADFVDPEPYLEIWTQNGDSFVLNEVPIDNSTVNTVSFDLGDVNNDGFTDLVVSLIDGDDQYIHIILNDRTGIFGERTVIGNPGDRYFNATLGDFDNDGDLDIFSDGRFFVNDGSGNFTSGINYHNDDFRGVTEAVDLDGDGDKDIISVSENGGGVINSILRNYGNWSFVREQGMFGFADPTRMITSGDYDQDGDMDFFTKNAEFYGTNYQYTQKQNYNVEDSAEVRSNTVASTAENLYSATLHLTGYGSVGASSEFYVSSGALAEPAWTVVEDVPDNQFNGFITFEGEGEGHIMNNLYYGAGGTVYLTTDYINWEGLMTGGEGEAIVDLDVFDGAIIISDSHIYQLGPGDPYEVCTGLSLSGLRAVSYGDETHPYGYVVGEDGLIVFVDGRIDPANPICEVLPVLNNSNLNTVVVDDDSGNAVISGDQDEEGGVFLFCEEPGACARMEDGNAFLADINDRIYQRWGDPPFQVAVGDNGFVLSQELGDEPSEPIIAETGTTENLNSVFCESGGNCVIGGNNGTVLISDDGGQTVESANLAVDDDVLSVGLFAEGDTPYWVVLTSANEIYYIPAFGGVDYIWEGPVAPDEEWVFENQGTDLLWKAVLNTDDENTSPTVQGVSLSYSVAEDGGGGGGGDNPTPPSAPSRLEPDVVSASSIQWNFEDTASNEIGFKLYDEDQLIINDVATADLSYIVETGLSPDTQYRRYVAAYNSDGSSDLVDLEPAYTYANAPAIDSIVVTGSTSIGITLNENGNPNTTKYALYEVSLGKWLQTDYTLGATRVFQTKNAWLAGGSNIPVTNLTNNALYEFKAQAQNGANEETDFSPSKSIIVYKPNTANLILNKKVGVNVAPVVAGVYLGQTVFAGTDTAQKIKVVPLIQRYANIYTILAGGMVLLFLVLLVLNAHPKAKHLKHVHKILFTDFGGKRGDQLFELLHGSEAAKKGKVYKNHHRFYKLTNLGVIGVIFGVIIKVVAVIIAGVMVYGTVQVQAFENQSGVDVKAGDKLTYQIEYLNNGGTTAHNVVVTEPIPTGVAYVPGSITSTGNKCSYVNNAIVCNVGDLTSDSKGTLEFKAGVTGGIGTTIVNIANGSFTEATDAVNSNSTTNNIVTSDDLIKPGETRDVSLVEGWNFFRMAVTSRVRFAYNKENHSVELTSADVKTKKAAVRVMSDPVNVVVGEGEIKGVDSNGNSFEDMDIKIQSVESDAIAVVGIKTKAEDIPQAVCGDKKCNGKETCASCVADCGECPKPVCGDKLCNNGEKCNTCPGDCGVCPPVAICGDGKCNGNETCNTCAGDCGACKPEDKVGGVQHVCSDNLDNDGDGKVDMEDPGCVNLNDDDETDELVPEQKPEEEPKVAEDKVVNAISTIVSGVTKTDIEEVRQEVKQIISKTLINTIDNPVAEKVNQVAQNPVVIATTAASVASIAAVGATGSAGVGVLTYLQFLFTQPLMLLTRRRRQNWGIIYDAITKKPIDLAIIRLFEVGTNRLVTTRVTDKQGRYQLIVKPGRYTVKISKKDYRFPSEIIPQLYGSQLSENIVDDVYQNLYNGGIIEVKVDDHGIINRAIPIDPEKKMETNQQIFKRLLWVRVQSWLTLAGPIIAIISYAINPKAWVGALVIIQIIIYFIFKRLAKMHKPLTWGNVKDLLTGQILKKTVVRVFDTRFNKLLDTQVTDNNGKYGFLVGRGEYYLTGERDGYENYKSTPYNLSQVPSGYLAEEIKMKKTGEGSSVNTVEMQIPRRDESLGETQTPINSQQSTVEAQSDTVEEKQYDVDVFK